MAKEQSEKWKKFWNKYKYIALITAFGTLLLLWPTEESKSAAEAPIVSVSAEKTVDDLTATENKMKHILSKIQGVGQLELMLTLDKSASSQYVENTDLRYDGQAKMPENYQRTAEPVILTQDNQEALILEESTYPTYRGCLVVCEGGENAAVKLSVTSAVAALTGLSSDRITVTAWQN